jgi:acyl transferase domain-containing protein/acyl carrier protein
MIMSHGNGKGPAPPRSESAPSEREPIAVIGIGCRFPGRANHPESFWRLLEEGVDAITEVPADRWNLQAFHDPDPSAPGKSYSRWGGFVEGIDRFDSQFFGISPREAARMDPQQRLLLEVAWEGLEDGGIRLDQVAGSRTSVFVGISSFDYPVLETSFRDRGEIDVYSNTGGSLSIAANRISYCFDFRGTSAAVDTACSSALVAVHLACRSIWEDDCPMALAGGVNALLLPDWYVGFCRMGMLSPEGRCRAFAAAAAGFVRSEGAGIVVLKPAARAVVDGDRIYAIIRGTAVNQDGRTPGMTVPSQEAQEELLRQACRDAGVAPGSIQYVEAHGTGTPVGDPIEARALGRVLSAARPRGEPCLLGSVKTNIGHLEAASGIAGLIKVALALRHRRIPGNLHFDRPNPDINFEALRLRVPTRCEAWPAHDAPAVAGVNSFGFGGTNAHVILQQAPVTWRARSARRHAKSPSSSEARASLIPLSARSPAALRATARSWLEFVTGCSADVALDEIAASAALFRTHHDHRLAVVAGSTAELAERLREAAEDRASAGVAQGRAAAGHRPRIAFVCSGQGPQWWAMGRQLLDEEPVFRAAIERCDAIVRRLGDWSLFEELTSAESRSRIDNTAIAQPCIFALQVALAELWASWGVRPEAVIGHSVGEVAAAFLAGVFSLDDAVRIIYHRGRLMERVAEGGRMLAVKVSPEAARELAAAFGDRVELAAVNSPSSVTLSGEAGPLEEIAALLEERGVFHRFLKVRYAFHSEQMRPVRSELLSALEGIRPRLATVPLISTVTGRLIEGPELGPEYWWDNVRRTVQFAAGVERLIELECDAAVELAAHPVLSAAVSECCQAHGKTITALPSLRRHHNERATMLSALGALYTQGQPIDWRRLLPEPERMLRLPLYPWQRESFWHEAEESRVSRQTAPAHPLLGFAQGGPRPTWEARLDLRQSPYLADHCVQRAVIMPAAAYLELGFAAACEAFGAVACELEDVEFANPCFLAPEEALRLQTSFDPDQGMVSIHTRPMHGDREWTVCLRASVHPRSPTAEADPEVFSPEAIRVRCLRGFSHEECYDHLAAIGLDYGPKFRGIEWVWQGERESLGLVKLAGALEPDAERSVFHPALLDACLQTVVAADGDFDRHDGGLYLPHEIESVRLFRRPGHYVWAHARLLEKTPRRSVAEVDVYNEDGALAARVRGLKSHRVAGGRDDTLDDLLYAYQWRPEPPREPELQPENASWLIFADERGVGARLAERLLAGGKARKLILVHAGSTFEELSGGHFRIDPGQPDQMLRLVQAVIARDESPSRGVVHLWNLDAPHPAGLSAEGLRTAQDAGLLSVVWFVQAWDRVAAGHSARLLLVTRGAQSVGDGPEPAAIAQAPALGLGRVIAGEYPRLRCTLVDLDPQASDQGVGALVAEIQAADADDEVAWRDGKRHVHRYLPAAFPADGELRRPARNGVPHRLTARTPGTLDGLVLEALSRRPPGAGEVEIEVAAAGLNFSDVMKALGMYPGLPDGPAPLGGECSGRITAIGEGVTGLGFGDEVIASAAFAFASHAMAQAELVVKKPPALSFEDAATLPIAFLTASYALESLGRLEAGERLLIHSASGGVGLAAIQLARRAGALVLATAGTPEKREYLRSLGIDCVMDSRSLDFADHVLERTGGRGVDVVLNSLPGEAIPRGIACLADYGRFLEIGKRDIYQNARLGLRPFRKNLSFFAIDLDRMIRDRPALVGSMLRDIVKRVDRGELGPLPHRAWPITEGVEAFRFMQQAKHVGKVVLTQSDQPMTIDAIEDGPVSFRAHASYLITGGLGGFGLAVARWMAERGAGTLVLMGRRATLTDEGRRIVADLEAHGTRVVIHAADVSQESDLADVLAAIDRDLPPLSGVIHAAMVLEDALLINLDRDRMDRVLAPKLEGTWNLHALTAGRPLDFFVMFSSLSSVFGHAGQGNYAAANAFLDAMAWYRRAIGLPALAINWGYLGGTGYLAGRPELGDRLERQGVMSFTVAEALSLLEKAMQRRHVQVGVMRVEWSRWRGLGVTGQVSPRFRHLCDEADSGRGRPLNGTLPGRDAIMAASPADRPRMLGALLCDKVARVLGTPPDRLDLDKPLLQLGIDSLMAVELRNWLEGELRVDLPIVELMKSPSVSGLASLLADRLLAAGNALPVRTGSNGAVNGSARAHEGPDRLSLELAPNELLARIDDLSGDQVDSILGALLGGTGQMVHSTAGRRAAS